MEITNDGLRIGKYDYEPITTQGNVKTLADLKQLGDILENFAIFHNVEHELNFDPKDFKISVAHIFEEIKDKIESLSTNKQNKYIKEVKQCLYNFNQDRVRFEAFIEVEVEPAYKLKEGSFSPVPLVKMIELDFELLNHELDSSKILLENHKSEVSTSLTEINSNIPNEKQTKNISINPYPEIFKGKDNKAFRLFEELKEMLIDGRARGVHANYSFIYRKMISESEGLIHNYIKDGHFRNWLKSEYFTDIEKTSLLDYCTTDNKTSTYSRLKTGIFSHKQ